MGLPDLDKKPMQKQLILNWLMYTLILAQKISINTFKCKTPVPKMACYKTGFHEVKT